MTWRTSRFTKGVFSSGVSHSASARDKRRNRTQLRVQQLVDRALPSTFTPTVFTDGGPGSGSLRAAILQANADTGQFVDIINLQAGTYTLSFRNTAGHEDAGLQGDLNITNPSHELIIQGLGSLGANATMIDASQLQDRAFQIVNPGSTVIFQNLVIQGGLAQDNGTNGAPPGTTAALGGAILNNGGNLIISNVVLQNNEALGGNGSSGSAGHNAAGGAIYSTGGSVTCTNGSPVLNNQAVGGNGGAGASGGPSAAGGAGGAGGAAQGGGIYLSQGTLTVTGATISGNQASGGRGGAGGSGGNEQHSGQTGPGGNGGSGGNGAGGGWYAVNTTVQLITPTVSSNTPSGGGSGSDGGTAPHGFLSVSFGLGGGGGAGGSAQGGGVYTSGGALTVITSGTISTNSVKGGGAAQGGDATTGGTGGPGQGGGLYSSGATGNDTLSAKGGTGTVIATGDANYTLTNSLLTVSTGGTFKLTGIKNAVLTGGASNNMFTVSGWTGTASLIGGGGTDTVVDVANAQTFTLTKSSLSISSGGTFALSGIGQAILIGGTRTTTMNAAGFHGTAVLDGGGGKAKLTGGCGRNILIGGTGQSTLIGGAASDLLIGDSTSYDSGTVANITALEAIMAEWASADSYTRRISDLLGTTSGGLNGSNFLNSTTVFNAHVKDTMTGRKGRDWFFSSSGDVITDLNKGGTETVTTI
jgi:hypothetical protein